MQAKERGYETMVNFGKQGLNFAATAAVTAAVKVNQYCLLDKNNFLFLCLCSKELDIIHSKSMFSH